MKGLIGQTGFLLAALECQASVSRLAPRALLAAVSVWAPWNVLQGAVNSKDYYYPLVAEAKWVYKASGGPAPITIERSVLTTNKTIHGARTFGLRETWDGELRKVTWMTAETDLLLHRIEMSESAAPAGHYLEGPLRYAPGAIGPNEVFSFSANYATILEGEGEPAVFPGSIQGTSTVGDFESVTVAAGSFQCLKLGVAEDWYEYGEYMYTLASSWWMANDIGIVKMVDETGYVWELESWFIPGPEPPIITAEPKSQTVTEGSDVSFKVEATGIPPLLYHWKKDGNDLPGQTNAILRLLEVALSAAGDYQVVVTDTAGSRPSAIARLTVNPSSPPVAPRFVSWQMTVDKQIELGILGEAGKAYDVEASTDLKSWSLVAQVTARTQPVICRDTNAPTFRHRLYRLRETAGN